MSSSNGNGAFKGQRLRDAGIDLVRANAKIWFENAVEIVMKYAPDGEFMPEIFHDFPGIGTPHSDKCWGVLSMILIRRGFMVKIDGRYAVSRRPGNHGHEYKIYRRRIYRGNLPPVFDDDIDPW